MKDNRTIRIIVRPVEGQEGEYQASYVSEWAMIRSCGLKRKSISFGRTNINHFTDGRICSWRSLSHLKA
jgi:hypothetical protein